MECCCYLRNVQDLLSDGKTLYERRFGLPFNGPVIPFGAMLEYHRISAEDLSRLHQFGPEVLPGIFLGYVLSAGGIWKGDTMVADIGELWQMDASELHARRLNAKEVLTPMKRWKFHIPNRRWRGKTSWRRSGSENIHLNLGQPRPRRRTRKPSRRIRRIFFNPTSRLIVVNDFWSISVNFIYRHNVEPRVKLYVPREASFPIPLTYIDATRATSTSLDVMLEKNIDDY